MEEKKIWNMALAIYGLMIVGCGLALIFYGGVMGLLNDAFVMAIVLAATLIMIVSNNHRSKNNTK